MVILHIQERGPGVMVLSQEWVWNRQMLVVHCIVKDAVKRFSDSLEQHRCLMQLAR